MISDWDKERWEKRISDLEARRIGRGEPSIYDLHLACEAIAASPYSWITDAMLRINGGFLDIGRYDRVLAVLLEDDVLTPIGYNRFQINRKKAPAS